MNFGLGVWVKAFLERGRPFSMDFQILDDTMALSRVSGPEFPLTGNRKPGTDPVFNYCENPVPS
jgi:hypothetical protein